MNFCVKLKKTDRCTNLHLDTDPNETRLANLRFSKLDLEWVLSRYTPSMHTHHAELSVNYQVRTAYICIYTESIFMQYVLQTNQESCTEVSHHW